MWILVIKLDFFVVGVKIYSDDFAAINFSNKPEKDSFRIFCSDLNVLSFLCIFDHREHAITVKVEYINNEFEFLLFGGVPLEDELIFVVEIEGEGLSDGELD